MFFQQKQAGSIIKGQKATYTILNQIGSGSGGVIYLAQIQNTQQKVAIKIQKYMNHDEQYISQVMVTKVFKNIVNIQEFFQNTTDKEFVIIMDYCMGGDLRSYLQKNNFNQEAVKQLITQIIEGTQELHNLNFIHRDLKPDNILVFYDTYNKSVTLKLCDLGLVKNEDKASTINIGTPYYMAPELINFDPLGKKPLDNSIDVWALGCIWYEMLSKKFLFNGYSVEEVYRKIVSTNQSLIDQQIDLLTCNNQKIDLRDKKILKRMICIDPKQRLTAQQILQTLSGTNKYINQSNFDPIQKELTDKYEKYRIELEQKKMAEIKLLEENYQNQLMELQEKMESNSVHKQQEIKAEIQKIKDQYELEKQNKQFEAQNNEERLRQMYQQQFGQYQQQQIETLRQKVIEKKEKYDSDLQNFQEAYRNILPKLPCLDIHALEIKLNQIYSNEPGNSKWQIQELEKQINQIESQRQKLQDCDRACQQRSYFLQFENMLNEQNRHYYILNEQIQQLKQSLRILNQDELNQLNQLVQQYQKEEELIKEQNLGALQKYQVQQLTEKRKKFKEKLSYYTKYYENIKTKLKNEFQELLQIDLKEYEKLDNFQNLSFLKELQNLSLSYKKEQYNDIEQQFDQEQFDAKQLDEIEEQLDTINTKQGQIERDQQRLKDFQQLQKIIEFEYQKKIEQQQKLIEEMQEQIQELYTKKSESYELYKADFKKNQIQSDEQIDEEFNKLTEVLNQERQKLKEQCKTESELHQELTLSKQISQSQKSVKIISILQERVKTLQNFDAKTFFKTFQENLIYKPTKQKEYSINKVKLRSKIKDQALIRQLLRLQDLDSKNNRNEIVNLNIQRYDELIKKSLELN